MRGFLFVCRVNVAIAWESGPTVHSFALQGSCILLQRQLLWHSKGIKRHGYLARKMKPRCILVFSVLRGRFSVLHCRFCFWRGSQSRAKAVSEGWWILKHDQHLCTGNRPYIGIEALLWANLTAGSEPAGKPNRRNEPIVGWRTFYVLAPWFSRLRRFHRHAARALQQTSLCHFQGPCSSPCVYIDTTNLILSVCYAHASMIWHCPWDISTRFEWMP